MPLNKEDIERKIRIVLDRLRERDRFLIANDTNERTISHKIAEYLQQEFPEFNVDCEYNRHQEAPKELDLPREGIDWDDTEAKTVFPDIVVHKRGHDLDNLLVIEIKKTSNRTDRRFDGNKLRAFTRAPYNYTFGLRLEVDVAGEQDGFFWLP